MSSSSEFIKNSFVENSLKGFSFLLEQSFKMNINICYIYLFSLINVVSTLFNLLKCRQYKRELYKKFLFLWKSLEHDDESSGCMHLT